MVYQIIRGSFRTLMNDFDRIIAFLSGRYPPPGLCLAFDQNIDAGHTSASVKRSIFDTLKDGFLWGVPKRRRSLERRHKRKYGNIDQYYKLIIPQNDLDVCVHCGHDYKRGYLCKNCYTKVMDETKQIQDRILEELKLDPVQEEVVVLYEREEMSESPEFWKGKRIVEMRKERPEWFSKNLKEKATTTTSDSTEVKPEQLG